MLALGVTLFFYVGRDFFPVIDGGQIQLHVRASAGTRIEKSEQLFQAIEDTIREVIPDSERASRSSTTSDCQRATTISPSRTERRSASTTG
jgi:multidrug efflux pump subunit AcrB